MPDTPQLPPSAIAIIGMAGRFPGAADVDEYWQNLAGGVESITFFSEEELLAAGADPADLALPGSVPANGVLDGVELFDAGFFNYSPREAELMDPQHRLFLEAAWQALEVAGYDPKATPGAVAVYAGTEMSTYLLHHIRPGVGGIGKPGAHQVMIGASQDFLPLRVSYRLGLHGPSVCVQTACSTSLVAVHMACQSLLQGESDVALAGGVTVTVPQVRAYIGSEEGILSPDGHCRPFDAKARGTLAGNGLGVVVLKRLEDAVRDGDLIRAVIRGSAVNNDGARKAGFTAPSPWAQTAVIAEAQAVAGISPDTISYIEAHGTGTELGDPIEVEALTKAFRMGTRRSGFCAIGSVKGNIGHLDSAAGVAGLIKTVLALEHAQIPPSLHLEQPNPAIDFERSPFFVNTALRPWPSDTGPRRAGVSAFGIGGTNAHVVLEEAPALHRGDPSRPCQLLLLSAHTPTALDQAATNLADHLTAHPGLDLADVAHTLRVGRHPFAYRRAVVCHDAAEAVAALRADVAAPAAARGRAVGFLFPGQGTHYPRMGRELYEREPVFRAEIDRCVELLRPEMTVDPREILFPEEGTEPADLHQRTDLAQPVLFTIQYALAKLWMSFGIRPAAMLGHSVGEYVAACLSGALALPDALRIIAARGRLVHDTAEGAMLAVALSEPELRPHLRDEVDLAAVNSAAQCVVSGTPEAVDALARRLAAAKVATRRLNANRGFHSRLLQPAAAGLEKLVAGVTTAAPELPYVSNVTGTWVREDRAESPAYWGRHLTGTVRFDDGLATLWSACDIVVEIGTGDTLTRLARRHAARPADAPVVASLPGPDREASEQSALLQALGRLWTAGCQPDWEGFRGQERRRRVVLPTYPFQRQRYWIRPDETATPTPQAGTGPSTGFAVPVWKQSSPTPRTGTAAAQTWLLLSDDSGLGDRLVAHLRHAGEDVTVVRAGSVTARTDADGHTIDPDDPQAYRALLAELGRSGWSPQHVVHLWGVTPPPADPALTPERVAAEQHRGFHSVVALAQALAVAPATGTARPPVRLSVVTSDALVVTGSEPVAPQRATVLGPCRVVPLEHPGIDCLSIDVSYAEIGDPERLAVALVTELRDPPDEPVTALRGGRRWVPALEPVRLDDAGIDEAGLRERGVYLVTGGLGGIGMAIAEDLAAAVRARLVLLGRRGLPAEAEWDRWLAAHDEQDWTARAIRRVRAMRDMGAEVHVIAADVADEERMRQVLADIEASVGPVNGVVHAAGVPGGGLFQRTSRAATEAVLAAKVTGTAVLYGLLADTKCDFIALMSSHSSLVGDVGQIDYTAANAFLDAVAQYAHNRTGPRVFAVNWDTWREDGMAVRSAEDLARRFAGTPGDGSPAVPLAPQTGLSNAEGVTAFRRVLASGLSQVIVCPQGMPSLSKAKPGSGKQLAPASPDPRSGGYARPDLATRHVAPSTPTEQVIAEIWQDLLGVSDVGIDDDFLALGGHSLLATQLVSRLGEQLRVTLPLHLLFELRTVRDQARYVELALSARQPERSAMPAESGEIEEGEL